MRRRFDSLFTALVLVRIGQELGTDSALARAVYVLSELAGKLAPVFSVDKF